MCAQEIYGIPDTGTVEEAERITPEALYQKMCIRDSHITSHSRERTAAGIDKYI